LITSPSPGRVAADGEGDPVGDEKLAIFTRSWPARPFGGTARTRRVAGEPLLEFRVGYASSAAIAATNSTAKTLLTVVLTPASFVANRQFLTYPASIHGGQVFSIPEGAPIAHFLGSKERNSRSAWGAG
jgi:hypothetical protein